MYRHAGRGGPGKSLFKKVRTIDSVLALKKKKALSLHVQNKGAVSRFYMYMLHVHVHGCTCTITCKIFKSCTLCVYADCMFNDNTCTSTICVVCTPDVHVHMCVDQVWSIGRAVQG